MGTKEETMQRSTLALLAIIAFTSTLAKEEYLVSGVKPSSHQPFGAPPEIIDNIPHDKCAVSIPVPGNDDSMTLVALGINRAIWLINYNGDEWGEWVNMNKTASSGPSAIRDEKDQLHIFTRGMDGLIWHRFEKNGEWSDWLSLGNVKTSTGPVAVINSEGLLSVFAIGSNKAVWVNNQEGLADSEGVCTSGKAFPTADQESRAENGESVATTDTGFDESSPSHTPIDTSLLEVGADTLQADAEEPASVAPDKELVANATLQANNEWARINTLKTSSDSVKDMKYVWSGWENLGGVWTNKPSVNINNEGLLSVYVRGVDRSLYVASQETSSEHGLVWGDWVWLKGNLASFPKVSTITTAEGLSVITVRNAEKKSFSIKKQTMGLLGAEWGLWEDTAGIWASGPTVLSPNSDTIELFGLAPDLTLRHTRYTETDGEGAWSTEENLQGTLNAAVSVTKDTSGMMHIFGFGANHGFLTKVQSQDADGNEVWGAWESLPGGAFRDYAC